MGYSIRTDYPEYRYTEWISFQGEYSGFDTENDNSPGQIQIFANWSHVFARELYVLAQDPAELSNVAEDPSYIDLAHSLSRKLREGWRAALPPLGQVVL